MLLPFVLIIGLIVFWASLCHYTGHQIAKFIVYAFPCFWTFAVMFIVLVIWKVGLNEPDLIPVALVTVAIMGAAILLMKKCYWISLPMIALGIYIALQDDQFVGHIFRGYGIYLILHYAVSGVCVYRGRKGDKAHSS